MCFSASASFAASAGLLIVGVMAVRQSNTAPQRVLASIPVIFSVQQFAEGLLWLSLSYPSHEGWQNISTYLFLLFAQVVWPSVVPFAMLLFEKNIIRKRILRVLLGAGILTSLYLSYCLCFFDVKSSIQNHHIRYELYFPLAGRWISGLGYTLATVISPFISSNRRLRNLGWLLLISYLITRIMYQDYLISAWCYFAALLSLLILFIIRKSKVNTETS